MVVQVHLENRSMINQNTRSLSLVNNKALLELTSSQIVIILNKGIWNNNCLSTHQPQLINKMDQYLRKLRDRKDWTITQHTCSSLATIKTQIKSLMWRPAILFLTKRTSVRFTMSLPKEIRPIKLTVWLQLRVSFNKTEKLSIRQILKLTRSKPIHRISDNSHQLWVSVQLEFLKTEIKLFINLSLSMLTLSLRSLVA
jgi:hypothetical protein